MNRISRDYQTEQNTAKMTAIENERRLLALAESGDAAALHDLLNVYFAKLVVIASYRMHPRLASRVDPQDVVQDAFVDATRRFTNGQRDSRIPIFIWLRLLTVQRVAEIHRRHFGTQSRDAGREVSIFYGPTPHSTSAVLAAQLIGKDTSPSQAYVKSESKRLLEQKLNEMDPKDRQVLELRYFEQLSNQETARILDMTETATSSRFVRALQKLKQNMQE